MAEQQPRRHAVRGQRPSSGGTSAGVPRPCQRGRLERDPTDQVSQAWADGGSFIIDTTGVGKGIADHLAAKGYAVTYFDSSTPVRDKRYGNPRAEAYMTMREAFQAGTAAIPPNEELLAELLAVKYEARTAAGPTSSPRTTSVTGSATVRTWPTSVRWRSVARPKRTASAVTSAISGFEVSKSATRRESACHRRTPYDRRQETAHHSRTIVARRASVARRRDSTPQA